MDKKTILAVVISMVIWVGWQKLYMEPIQQNAAVEAGRLKKLKEEELKKTTVTEAQKSELDAVGVFPEIERKKVLNSKIELKDLTLEAGKSKTEAGNEAFALKNWDLKDYFTSLEKKKEDFVDLRKVTGFSSQLRLRTSDDSINNISLLNWRSLPQVNSGAVLSETGADKWHASRKVELGSEDYSLNVDYQIEFSANPPKFVFIDLFGSPKRDEDKEGSIFGQAPDKVRVSYRDSTGRHSDLAVNIKEPKESVSGLHWLGLDTRYFVFAVVPADQSMKLSSGVQIIRDGLDGKDAVRASLAFPTEGKNKLNIPLKVYFGPKNLESLQRVAPILTDAIDFGWTSFLAVPLLQALKWLFNYVRNYGIAIILLTFFIKMLLFPLTYKSMKSMAKMAKLQPQLNALREKYKDDKEKLNTEMMGFMKNNGYNPIGGCLPILLQMPIFFSLYRVLFNSMELYQAPFGMWIHDLSAPDPFYVTPVLLMGLMFLQQKVSPNTSTDPAQQKMLQFMPVMFGMFMLMLPAGLNIYMVVNSGVSIAQQWILNHKLGIRKVTA